MVFLRPGSTPFSSSFNRYHNKHGDFQIIKVCLAVVILVLVECEGQTFQYSRGWTNGKRSGFPQGTLGSDTGLPVAQSPFDSENGGVVSLPSAEDASGTLRMRATGSQGRLRSADYAQYLNKKFSSAGNVGGNRKQPIWIVEQEPVPGNAEF